MKNKEQSPITQSIVTLENVSKTYLQGKVEVHAVNNVSLAIKNGDFAALCGPSGSGKTSILNLIGGLDQPNTGQIAVDNVNLASLSGSALSEIRKHRIGFVFQAYNLIQIGRAHV